MTTATLTFDTLRYAKRLKDADVPDKQAEAQAEALREVLSERDGQFSNLQTQVQTLSDNVERDAQQAATTADIFRLDTKLDTLNTKLDTKIDLVRKDMTAMELGLRKDMEALENRLVIRLTKSMLAAVGLGVAASTAIVRLLA